MENAPCVIIVSGSSLTNILYGYLLKENKYNVVVSSENVEAAIKLGKNYSKAIFIMDYSSDKDDFFNDLAEKIKNNNFRGMLLCDAVKDGFGFLNRGADEIITKPKEVYTDFGEKKAFLSIIDMKIAKIIREYDENKRAIKKSFNTPVKKIIAIGSSTGGTDCVEQILKALPEDTPPILIVQHMPPVFTGLFSQRLNAQCKMTVLETEDGDVLENGVALVAPGDKQTRLHHKDGKYYVTCKKEGLVGGHEPSVDVLFESVANAAGSMSIGVILTGMGRDGARGLLKMRNAGAITLGQDESSSVVYGMPKVAYDIGAVSIQGDLAKITGVILQNINT